MEDTEKFQTEVPREWPWPQVNSSARFGNASKLPLQTTHTINTYVELLRVEAQKHCSCMLEGCSVGACRAQPFHLETMLAIGGMEKKMETGIVGYIIGYMLYIHIYVWFLEALLVCWPQGLHRQILVSCYRT